MNPKFKFALVKDVNDDKQFIPTQGEPFATGYDVRSRISLVLNPGDYFKIPLGFRAMPEKGWWFQLHPRSSSFTKKYMHNLVGIIDEHYNQEVIFAGQYIPKFEFETSISKEFELYSDEESFKAKTDILPNQLIINFGDAIGQIIPVKRVGMSVVEISNKEYDDLCKQRMAIRNGGFGSTDKLK